MLLEADKSYELLKAQIASKASFHVIIEEMLYAFMYQLKPFVADITFIPPLLHIG